ncbi:hypothetical protein BDV06DRAFT_167605 [Aspergillus oleicola]
MYECEYCGATFYHLDLCDEHLDDYDHWRKCETCPRIFRTQRACTHHMDEAHHWAPHFNCESCPKSFRQKSAAIEHMDLARHWAPRTVPCETCNGMFRDKAAAEKHMKETGHWKNHCKACDKQFKTEKDLQTHLNKSHPRVIPCPFCDTTYTTAGDLSHHLESKTCPNAQLTRETTYRTTRERDTHHLVTYKEIGWTDDKAWYTATPLSWNGTGYECYLCHREFPKLAGLNQHLDSNVHLQSVYYCPNKRCDKAYMSLGGLFDHLEKDSCSFIRFERMQKGIGAVFGSGRRVAV